jgi:predicted component of viral defense system (DUF524 family)
MVQLPTGSTVLHGRHGYRDVFQHFARLRLASRVPLRADLIEDLLEARDIAELYELWCFFRLESIVTKILGSPTEADGPRATDLQLSVAWDLAVTWAGKARLFYNPQFSRSRPPQRRSYSVPLRPDIAIEVLDGPNAGLHLMDAKFKLERLASAVTDDASERKMEAEERAGTFERGDLYKMHAYRDAIPTAETAWVVYPGTELRFYDTSGEVSSQVEPLVLPDPIKGVGAIPLAPFARDDRARRVVAQLLGCAEDV